MPNSDWPERWSVADVQEQLLLSADPEGLSSADVFFDDAVDDVHATLTRILDGSRV
jgi:hypothetical protein